VGTDQQRWGIKITEELWGVGKLSTSRKDWTYMGENPKPQERERKGQKSEKKNQVRKIIPGSKCRKGAILFELETKRKNAAGLKGEFRDN